MLASSVYAAGCTHLPALTPALGLLLPSAVLACCLPSPPALLSPRRSTLIFVRVLLRVVSPVLLAVVASVLFLTLIPSFRDSCWAAVDGQMGNLPVRCACQLCAMRTQPTSAHTNHTPYTQIRFGKKRILVHWFAQVDMALTVSTVVMVILYMPKAKALDSPLLQVGAAAAAAHPTSYQQRNV